MSGDPAPSARMLASAVVERFAAAVGERVGMAATVDASPEPVVPAWTVTIRVEGATPGAVTLGMSRGDCDALLGLAGVGEVSDGAIARFLTDMAGEALAAVSPEGDGGTMAHAEAPCAVTAPPLGVATAFIVHLTPECSPRLGVWTVTGEAQASREEEREPLVSPLRLAPPPAAPPLPANLDVILDIDLPLSVRFGQTDLTLDALTRLGPGSLIALGRSPDEAVDVLVNGRLVARAEVVVVGGNYGVRILEVVSTADRVRSLGA